MMRGTAQKSAVSPADGWPEMTATCTTSGLAHLGRLRAFARATLEWNALRGLWFLDELCRPEAAVLDRRRMLARHRVSRVGA